MNSPLAEMLKMIGEQASNAERTCSRALQGDLAPVHAANHLIGIASYMLAVAHEIKDDHQKERL